MAAVTCQGKPNPYANDHVEWTKVWNAEHKKYMYTNGTKGMWEPPNKHPDTFMKSMHASKIRAFYDGAAMRLGTMQDGRKRVMKRERMDTDDDFVHVRKMGNWIKQCMLYKVLKVVRSNKIKAVDFACGRGQDIRKWKYVCEDLNKDLIEWSGVDISRTSLKEALSRAKHDLIDTRLSLHHCDLAAQLISFPENSMHIATLFLSLHYFFEHENRLKGVFSNLHHCVQSKGFVCMTYTEGEAIVRRVRREMRTEYRIGNCYGIQMEKNVVQTLCSAKSKQVFGLHAFHKIGSSSDNDAVSLTEWLTHEPTILKIADDYMFKPVLSMNAVDFMRSCKSDDHLGGYVARRMGLESSWSKDGALDVMGLYHVLILRKE